MSAMKARLLKGGVNGLPSPIVSPTEAPPVVASRIQPIQSYFDYLGQAVGAQALISNPPGTQIINPVTRNDSGYSLGLAPWSEAPVVVSFKVGGQRSTSAPLLMKPGQILRPQGLGREGKAANFNGFDFGLPPGWLGGGLVTIFVFPSASAEVKWDAGRNEVLFHCQQVQVRESALTPPANLKNWPVRFPWADAARYDSVNNVALQQNGSPGFAITETTRVLLTLRGAVSLAAAAPVRAILWGTDTFAHLNNGITIDPNNGIAWDTEFPATTAGGFVANDPVIELPVNIFGLGGSLAGLTLDVPAGSPLLTAGPDGGPCLVDIARYGRLG